jgi:endonuclease YncB( thermonuclease family)
MAGLTAGETAVAAQATSATRFALDNGHIVFLAEVDAPQGEAPMAFEAQKALSGLISGRPVRLGFGARQTVRLRNGQEAALAHVFVRTESGRWIWVQGEMVDAGFAWVRPRPGEDARAEALLRREVKARESRLGLWDEAAYQPKSIEVLELEAPTLEPGCQRGPFRLLEGRVASVEATPRGVYLNFGPPGTAFEDVTVRLRPEDLPLWTQRGLHPEDLADTMIRARGTLGLSGGPMLCVEHPLAIERLTDEPLSG